MTRMAYVRTGAVPSAPPLSPLMAARLVRARPTCRRAGDRERQPEVRASNRLRTTVCTSTYTSIRFSAGRPRARATGEHALSPPLVRTRPAGRAASALERPGPEFGRHRGDTHPPPMHAQGTCGRGVMANATRPRHERDRTLRIRRATPSGSLPRSPGSRAACGRPARRSPEGLADRFRLAADRAAIGPAQGAEMVHRGRPSGFSRSYSAQAVAAHVPGYTAPHTLDSGWVRPAPGRTARVDG